jgi:hypothetical protein
MNKISHLFLALLLFFSTFMFAQETTESETTETSGKQHPFKIGFYVGSYFANKYTAGVYDGYGFDMDGVRINVFEKSWMYEKIINQYGGGYGQTDLIAQALNVNPRNSSSPGWDFNKNDMPVNMRYTASFLFGLQCRYSVDNKNAISLNVNASKLNVSGNFKIVTTLPTGATSPNNKGEQWFGIKGGEQRLMIQIGYNRLFGDNETINFFAEGGLNLTYSQFDKNEILINNLKIDLTEFYDYQGIQAGYTRLPRGMGFGAYAGLGINIAMGEKFTIQLIYSPSYEGIKIGDNPKLKWQNSVGLRAYYNF